MTRPDDLLPEEARLDAVVDGAPPADAGERELARLVTELRDGADSAPVALRERVAAVADVPTPPTWRDRFRGRLPFGSTLPRAAAVAGAVVLVAALVVSVPLLVSGEADGGSLASVAPDEERAGRDAAPVAPVEPEANLTRLPEAAAGGAASGAPPPTGDPRRPQEIVTRTRVAVEDVQALSAATSRAMRIARRLGGFTQSSDYSVPNGELGISTLVLRVPSGNAGTAVEEFDELGTVLAQEADLTDLSQQLGQGRTALGRGAAELAALRRQVAADPDDEQLARRLAGAEERQRALTRRQRATRRRGDLATLNLTLTTEGPVDPPADGITGSLTSSGNRLAGIGVVTLAVLVTLVPFVLLALGLGLGARWALRRYRP